MTESIIRFPYNMMYQLGERSSFLPNNISGLQLWLDAADLSTITKDGSDKVSQWDDKSGNGNNATQGTSIDQPTYVSSGIGGKASIDYTGSAEMDLLSQLTFTDDWSMFVVLNTDDVATTRMFLGDSVNTCKIGIVATNKFFVRADHLGSSDSTVEFAAGDSIFHLSKNASDKVDIAFNGLPLIRLFSDAAQSGTSIFNLIGNDAASNGWDGDVAEVIIYNRALSTLERENVETYLSNKWDIVFSPSSLSGLQLWLDASDLSTITKDGSDKVSQWDDKSGNGNHAAQGTSINQPLFTLDQLNGKSTLVYDGVDDALSIPDSDSLSLLGDITVVHVGLTEDRLTFNGIISKSTPTLPHPFDIWMGITTGLPTLLRGDGSGGFGSVAGTSIRSLTEASVYTGEMEGTAVNHYINGTDAGSGTISVTITDGGGACIIGNRPDGATPYKGDYAEILVFNRALSTAERTAVTNYLSNKWGVTLPVNWEGLTNFAWENSVINWEDLT